jgi:hypothetical protein
MILAEPSSGRSLLASSSRTKVARPSTAGAATASTGAPAPSAGVAAKAAVRTVKIFTGSGFLTTSMALPA